MREAAGIAWVLLLIGMVAGTPVAQASHNGIIHCPGGDPGCVAAHDALWAVVGLAEGIAEDVEQFIEDILGLPIVEDIVALATCLLNTGIVNWLECI